MLSEWSLWWWERRSVFLQIQREEENKDRWNMKLRSRAWESGAMPSTKAWKSTSRSIGSLQQCDFLFLTSRKFQSFYTNMHRACITATVMDEAMKTPYALAFCRVYPISSGTGCLWDSPACSNDTHCSIFFIIFNAVPRSIHCKTALAFRFLLHPARPTLNLRLNRKKNGLDLWDLILVGQILS